MSNAVAVLVSGGLDSAVLTAELTKNFHSVHPLYIRQGLYWEEIESAHLKHFLEVISEPTIQPLQILQIPVTDLYGEHWSISGDSVPDATTSDEAVYLPGRNLMLLSKIGIWCDLHDIQTIALAPLKGNPFMDNTDEFYQAMEHLLQLSFGRAPEIIRPFSSMAKAQVIRLGQHLPLAMTFSCIKPVAGRHCGKCNKCAERKRAFMGASIPDKTDYA